MSNIGKFSEPEKYFFVHILLFNRFYDSTVNYYRKKIARIKRALMVNCKTVKKQSIHFEFSERVPHIL